MKIVTGATQADRSRHLGFAPFLAFLLLVGSAHAVSLQPQIDSAPPGATITIPAGTYDGPIVINKPLTLIGAGFPTIRGNGKGSVVTITADHATLDGFRITGSGVQLMDDDAAVFVTANDAVIRNNEISDSLHGVYLKKVARCEVRDNRIHGKTTLFIPRGPVEKDMQAAVENCDVETLVANRRGNGIHVWNSESNVIAGNEISDARDGIYFSFAHDTRVENNRVDHVRYGLHYMYSDRNVFVGNTFAESAAGAALMFSKWITVRNNRFVNNTGARAYGIVLLTVEYSDISQNVIEHDAVGISFNQCSANRVIGNRIERNYIGLRFGDNCNDNQFSLNRFAKNLHPVEIVGDVAGNRWSIAGVGNSWEGAPEFDLDGDGINDLPHRELDVFGLLRRDFPTIAFLSDSPAMRLLRFAHQRAAVPGFNSVEDRASLTAPGWALRVK